MQKHGVVVATDALFLSDAFKRLIDRADGVEVVGEAAHLATLLTIIKATRAQWALLFLPSETSRAPIVDTLLAEAPWLRVLVVSRNGAEVSMHWMETHDRVLPISTAEELVDMLASETQLGALHQVEE
jgi:hypothetical protein